MNIRLPAAILLLPSIASAHPGHGLAGFSGGVAHPFLGLDHVAAALAVGLWAAQLGGRFRWALPAGFIIATGLGLLFGLRGQSSTLTEPAIAASVVVLGALIGCTMRFKAGAAAAVVTALAWFHGLAHALEAPPVSQSAYFGGILLSTTIFHLAGLGAGVALLALGHSRLLRLGGFAIFSAGLLCALG